MRNKVKHNTGNNIKKHKLAFKNRSRRDLESNYGPPACRADMLATTPSNYLQLKINLRTTKTVMRFRGRLFCYIPHSYILYMTNEFFFYACHPHCDLS